MLNYWYLGSESATDRFHARTLKRLGTDVFRSKPLPDVRAHALVERSWHRVFDWKTLPHRLDYDTSPQTLQGTFWEIRPEDVVGVVEYGMGRPKRICR